MLSIGLWRWYINVTITILDIIHLLTFYLNHDVSYRCLKQRNVSKIYRFVRTSEETYYLRRRYEPNRLMLSIGLWPLYNNVAITVLNIIHRPVFLTKATIRRTDSVSDFSWNLLRPVQRQRLALFIGAIWVGSTWRRTQNPVSETLYF
jgi:hypothetical protein